MSFLFQLLSTKFWNPNIIHRFFPLPSAPSPYLSFILYPQLIIVFSHCIILHCTYLSPSLSIPLSSHSLYRLQITVLIFTPPSRFEPACICAPSDGFTLLIWNDGEPMNCSAILEILSHGSSSVPHHKITPYSLCSLSFSHLMLLNIMAALWCICDIILFCLHCNQIPWPIIGKLSLCSGEFIFLCMLAFSLTVYVELKTQYFEVILLLYLILPAIRILFKLPY